MPEISTFAPMPRANLSLRTASQIPAIIAVSIPDMTAAKRSARAIVELILGSAVVGAVEPAVVDAAIRAEPGRQIARVAPPIKPFGDPIIEPIARLAGAAA